MLIEDQTGKFSQIELDDLAQFTREGLLSTTLEREWLGAVRIIDKGAGYYGYWKPKFLLDENNRISGIIAVIVLNYFYLKTIDQLKKTLAHEYGHHWTLSYYAINSGLDIFQHRMPAQYYQLRGLSEIEYAHDYSKGWQKCDKEIIAEDYRVLFAVNPFNQEHRMVNPGGNPLALPNLEIENYITHIPQFH